MYQSQPKLKLSDCMDKIEWIDVYSNNITEVEFVEAVLERIGGEQLTFTELHDRTKKWEELQKHYEQLEALPQNYATDYYRFIIACHKLLINSVRDWLGNGCKGLLKVVSLVQEKV